MSEFLDLTIRTRLDTSGVRQDLADVQREADANPLELATRGGGGGSGTFSGESRSRLAPGVATVNPASALYNRLPSESVVVSSAAGAAPYLVGPAGWQGGVNPNTPAGMAAAGASPQPYGVGPGGQFPPGSVPLYSAPAAGTLRTAAPYELASTLPPWAAQREAENFGGPDTDLSDVEALGRGVQVADEGGRPSRRRGRGGFGGYGGILAIHFGTHLASGIARYSLRSQEIQSQLERGTDPQLDSLRAELEGIQGAESIPFFGQGLQIGEAITGRLSPNSYSKLGLQNRIQDIERERQDAQFQTGLGAERLESRMTADNLRRQAWQEGLTGTDAARAAANVSLAEQQDRAYARRAGLIAAVNTAPNRDALGKATDSLSEFDRDRPNEAVAEVALRDARIKAVARGELDRGRSIIDRGGAGILRAQGRFGAAAEEEFEAGLRGRERDALRNDPNNANLVREENDIERQARGAERQAIIGDIAANTRAGQDILAYNPAGAVEERSLRARQRAYEQAADPDDLRIRLAAVDVEERRGVREAALSGRAQDVRTAGLESRARTAELLSEQKPFSATAAGILDETRLAVESLDPEDPRTAQRRAAIRRTGIAQLTGFQNELQLGGLPTESAPGSAPPGAGDTGVESIVDALGRVEQAIKDLKADMSREE